MRKVSTHKQVKNSINKIAKHANGKKVVKPAAAKSLTSMPSLAEFRSKIHVKGKPLSQIINEGRG
jgi:hypothetical protein